MIDAIWALPSADTRWDTGSPFESLDRGPLQDRAPGLLVLDDNRDPSPGGAQVAAEAMPYHIRRRTECNTVRPRPGTVVELRSPVLAVVAQVG